MILVNGKASDSISINNRGLSFGDGLFETILVKSGQGLLVDSHLSRLLKGCDRLSIHPPDITVVSSEIKRLADVIGYGVIKLIYTRGESGRGYRYSESIMPTRVLLTSSLPENIISKRQSGITVDFCKTTLPVDPFFAGIKHLNRLHQVVAASELEALKVDEGLLCSTDGNVIEGTRTNLFIVKDRQLYTPDLINCGVEGVMRNEILIALKQLGIETAVQPLSVEDVRCCDHAFVSNSVIGIWPVSKLCGRPMAFGELCDKLIEIICDQIA
mgnify:CR=1 FL=1